MDVLLLMCSPECLLEKQMPDRLAMSLSTFKSHKEEVYRKCKVNKRLQLIMKAVQWGLVKCYCGGHASPGMQPPTEQLPDGAAAEDTGDQVG